MVFIYSIKYKIKLKIKIPFKSNSWILLLYIGKLIKIIFKL